MAVEVEFLELTLDLANNSPKKFEGGQTNFGDPCASGASPGEALIVFYDQVTDANFNVLDLAVDLHAEVLPGTVSEDEFNESWTKTHGPASGSLNRTDTFDVQYQIPQEGGLYKFEFELGLGDTTSGANLMLPLAGANMMNYLNQEVHSIGSWALSHKTATEDANYSMIPGVTRYMVLRTWISISASFFDYVFDPVDADQEAPCRRYQEEIGQNGKYGYVTIDGVVVHGSKLNNMLWALFGRWWGWSETSLRMGADLNQLGRLLRTDGPTSQNAIGLAADLYELLEADPSADISSVLTEAKLRSLVSSIYLEEERLWPSTDPADYGNSRFKRPILPTTP